MTDEQFAQVVRETIETLPIEFRDQIDNVEIVIQDWPNPEEDPYSLLGLYHGIPRTERQHYSALPDKITIFKEPLMRISHDEADLKQNIRNTVLHEIGHHFGLSDEELDKALS